MEQICGGSKLKGRNLVGGKSKIVYEMERVLQRETCTRTSEIRLTLFLVFQCQETHHFLNFAVTSTK